MRTQGEGGACQLFRGGLMRWGREAGEAMKCVRARRMNRSAHCPGATDVARLRSLNTFRVGQTKKKGGEYRCQLPVFQRQQVRVAFTWHGAHLHGVSVISPYGNPNRSIDIAR